MLQYQIPFANKQRIRISLGDTANGRLSKLLSRHGNLLTVDNAATSHAS